MNVNTSSTTMLTNLSSQNMTDVTDVYDGSAALWLTVLANIVCVVILIVGIVGNSLVLIVFGSRWEKLKSFEIYMISLATADLIATILYPSKMLYENLGGSFHGIGTAGCTVIDIIAVTSVAVSAFTLVVISFDRYVVVKWPLTERRSHYITLVLIMCTWLCGIILAMCLFLELSHGAALSVGGRCQLNFTTHAQFEMFALTIVIAESGVPFILLIVAYGLLIHELNKSTNLHIFQNREHIARSRYKRNRKATKLLIIIVLVFFASITPEKTFYVLYSFDYKYLVIEMGHNMISVVHTILAMIFMVNSCINPIIYAKLHTSFRRRTLRMFCACCCEKYKTYNWMTVRDSIRTVSTSIRRGSSRLSRITLVSLSGDNGSRRQRSCSAQAILQKEWSPSNHSHRTSRTFSTPGSFPGHQDVSLKELRTVKKIRLPREESVMLPVAERVTSPCVQSSTLCQPLLKIERFKISCI